jgi:DNA invertase Pin-like site-specific DNA recombinase
MELAAGGRITWAMAQSRGEIGGRVHIHVLIAGVDDLNMHEWQSKAIASLGDCQLETFDPEKGGTHYFARNALAEHGDYRLGGKDLENRGTTANKENVETGTTRTQLKTTDDPKPATAKVRVTQPVAAKRAAIYIRIGAETKADDVILRDRIPARPIEQLIRKRGWRLRRVYRDVAGAKAGKPWPHLRALMAAVRRGEVDVVIVSRLDRMARNTAEVVTVLTELEKLGVEFVSIEDGFDTTHKRGRALFAVVTTLGRMEHRLRSERSEAGLENAKGTARSPGNQSVGRVRSWILERSKTTCVKVGASEESA